MEAGVVLELGVGEQEGLFPLLVRQERLPSVVLPVGDVLRQVLVPALWQQEDADDADERAAGKNDVVQEVAFLVVQIDDGRRQHAEARAGQHQPQPAAPAGRHEHTRSVSMVRRCPDEGHGTPRGGGGGRGGHAWAGSRGKFMPSPPRPVYPHTLDIPNHLPLAGLVPPLENIFSHQLKFFHFILKGNFTTLL